MADVIASAREGGEQLPVLKAKFWMYVSYVTLMFVTVMLFPIARPFVEG
jgi:hypothetical protein